MYELIKVSDNCFYIQSPAKIGLVKINDGDVFLIDSGNDKDAGKKVKKILDANGWQLKMILNTHSNADHIGGNKFLREKTGCSIFAPEIECDFTRHPLLEPSFLFGAFPPKELRHKFLMAQESPAEILNDEVLPEGVSIIPLPGHFFNMAGFRTADDIVYLADCLSSKETLDKYGIGFIYDVGAYLDTLQKVKEMNARLFIPSHAEPTEDIVPLATYNMDKVLEIGEKICDFCKNSASFETILQFLFREYSLTMNFEQYALVGSTVRSYLVWLKETGKISAAFEDNMLLWTKI